MRRGRVVEQSKYLSLTGSKFGLNAFGAEGNDGRDGARSKSPFEWWANVKDRSHSRSSHLNQTMTETSSMCSAPPSPGLPRIYQRRDFNISTSSFGSAVKDDASVTVTEEPSSPPPLVRNFSRSFSRQGYNSTFSPRIQTLSRIEESSPHNSMISERASRIASYADKRHTPSPSLSTPVSTTQISQRSSDQNNSLKKSSLQYETVHHAIYIEPPPKAYNGLSTSFEDVETALPPSSNNNSTTDLTTGQQFTKSAEISPSTSTDVQNDSRTSQHPKRSSSKTGKVLRKKSLTRSALASRTDA